MKLFQALLFLMPPPSWLLFSDRLSFRWVQAQQECDLAKTKFDPFIHKSTYTIGVHATLDLETVFDETNQVFGEYLTATAGKRFDPPIQFNVVPNYFDGIFDAIENEEVDFLYSDPGVYSCIGTQVGATALATVVRKLSVRGRSFDLDVYGGVIAVRHDNDEINTIRDLKDKIIGAGAITDLMGGQMQINELERAGMSYVNDPKQVVFAKSQLDVVRGVISGRFDVGFVRTDQIELTTDQNGDLVDPDLFKIIEPKIYVMDSGELFPFLHSTDIYPEWPFAALPGVPADVQRAVQEALMDFGEHARIGQSLQECYSGKNESQWCDELGLNDVIPNAPCNSTKELSLLAVEGREKSDITRFRTASSYFDLRTMQQRAGFLIQDETMKWHCTRPTKIFEGITCPEGYYKRDETEFLEGCAHIGLSCDDNPEYDCFCKPCVKAHEVDVYYLDIGENDPHLEKFYGYSLPGCQKMSICGTIEQGDSITLRIFDNMHRQGANVTVEIHAGTTRKTVHARNIAGTDAYEFTLSDDTVQAQVIDILINGIAISQSPIRVMVVSADCKAEYGVGSHRVSDSEGRCVCAGHTYEMGSTCVESAFFFLIIFTAVFLAVGVLVFFYLGYKKKQSDSVWHIGVDDLHFNEPPEVIGQGGFGVVILGQYRGTKVAVKRVLPPSKVSKGNSSSIISEKDIGYQSTVATGTSHSDCRPKLHETKDGNRIVKFGSVTNSGDIESQIRSTNGTKELQSSSYSSSNKDWERLLEMRYSDHDVLKLLESATSSDHGSGLCSRGSISKSTVVLRYLPLCLRFDKHSRRVADFVNEMRMLSRLRHPCITTVMGAVISTSLDPMLVMEYMEYGSLYDLLHNETMIPGGEIILQVVRDIVQGIQFLHASKPPILHGDLKAKNILVDSRFRAKVADFGFSHFKTAKQRTHILQGTPFYMAPEYLRRRSEYTTACDMYSLAMIFYEIYARAGPFEGEDPRKLLPKICHPRLNKRPPIPESCPPKIVDLMKKCWSPNAFFRPSAKDVDYFLVEMTSRDTEPLETFKDHIREDLKRTPTSIYDVFPKHIADALNAGKKVEAESHEIVTVVFSDIVGFTTISQKFSPLKVAQMLDRLYQAFDTLCRKHHIFKVETVGDAYMGVTNLDGSGHDTHVKQVAEYAQDALQAASEILIDEDDPSLGYVQIRLGFHSGPVVSSVIGSLNPRYGLFGDTVNTASRMESNSMPGMIHCSNVSAHLLETQAPEIPLKLRGMIKIKGKGKMKTYWIGGDNLNKSSPSPFMARQVLDPLSECSERDGMQESHRHEHSNHSDEDTAPLSFDEIGVSHRTQNTVICDSSSESGSDEGIKVLCSQKKKSTTIQMDGTLKEIDTYSKLRPGVEIIQMKR